MNECGEGWIGLVNQIYERIPEGVVITEIFQKYGKLVTRFEPDAKEYEPFQLFLNDIEFRSETMCEKCGGDASLYAIEGWTYTRCALHSEDGIDLNNLPKDT